MADHLDHLLGITDAQRPAVGPILFKYQDQIGIAQGDESLTARQRQEKIDASKAAMAKELAPLLTPEQNKKLTNWLGSGAGKKAIKKWLPFSALTASYSRFLPTSSTARWVFGSSPASYGVGLGGFTAAGKRTSIGFGFDSFNLSVSGSKLFVLSPQVSAEYRVPIARDFAAFGRVLGGPAYFDYSFDVPGNIHYGAKRLGADAGVEAGIVYKRVLLDAKYRVFTQPGPLNFDGLQVSATLIVARF
jgi:hypothetical protein